MSVSFLILVINSVALLVCFILGAIILQSGYVYNRNPGDPEVQNRMKFRILRCIVTMVVIGLGLAIINILAYWGFVV